MKMAKASEADLDMAIDLISVLDDIESGYFPGRFGDPESESSERIDTYDRQQYDRLIDNLRRLLKRGSIGRVIMGMAVVCDPSNECIDPDATTIEHHPKRQQMEAALKDLEARVIAQQARIEQLRELLDISRAFVETDVYRAIGEQLSTPDDLSALRAHEEKLIRVPGNSYAGVFIWGGDCRIARLIDREKLESCIDPLGFVKQVIDSCLHELGNFTEKSDALYISNRSASY